MISAGQTLLYPLNTIDVPHLWIVLFDPDINDQTMWVNISTKRSGSDLTVCLYPGDHPYLVKESVVMYTYAEVRPAADLCELVRLGFAKFDSPIDSNKLERIKQGVLKSPFVSQKNWKYFQTRNSSDSNTFPS